MLQLLPFLSLLVLLVASNVASAVPVHPSCLEPIKAHISETQYTVLEDMGVKIYAMKPDKTRFDDARIECQFHDLQERFSDECNDDVDDADEALKKGLLWSLMNSTETRCKPFTIQSGELEPGVTGYTLGVKITRLDEPNLYTILRVVIPDKQYTYSRPGTPETGGYPYERSYSPGAAKLAMEVKNWPWHQPPVNNTHYLRIFFTCYIHTDSTANGTVSLQPTRRSVEVRTEKVKLNFGYDSVYEVDGHAFSDKQQNLGEFPADFDRVTRLPGSFSVCNGSNTLFNYTQLNWDPSLSALFLSPHNSKTSPKWLTPVAVVCSLIGAGIILLLILLTIFVPSVRHFFRPYSKRSETPEDTKNTLIPNEASSTASNSTQTNHTAGGKSSWEPASNPTSSV